MPTHSPAHHTSKLTAIRERMKALQQEEAKVCENLAQELSRCLIEAQALEIEFDTLIGGMLEVIREAPTHTSKAEVWRKSGQNFRRNRNQPSSGKKQVSSPDSS